MGERLRTLAVAGAATPTPFSSRGSVRASRQIRCKKRALARRSTRLLLASSPSSPSSSNHGIHTAAEAWPSPARLPCTLTPPNR